MLKLSLAAFAALSLIVPAFPVPAYAAGEGMHPWDQPGRASHRSHVRLSRRSPFVDNPYFQRTQTHALHPYYRNNYHTLLTVDRGNKPDLRSQLFLEGFPFFRMPSATSCSNFSYYRENYRIPPEDFRCIRH